MDNNTPQKQSWAEKPFLERLGIVLGILASIVAIVTLGYFMVDRYKPSVPADAAEMTTTEETSTETTLQSTTTTETITGLSGRYGVTRPMEAATKETTVTTKHIASAEEKTGPWDW